MIYVPLDKLCVKCCFECMGVRHKEKKRMKGSEERNIMVFKSCMKDIFCCCCFVTFVGEVSSCQSVANTW